MSQDLLAAFSQPHRDPSSVWESATPAPTLVPVQGQQDNEVHVAGDDDVDDFGEFEDGAINPVPQPMAEIIERPPEGLPAAASVRAAEVKKDTSKGATVKASKSPASRRPVQPTDTKASVGRHPFADHMDLLFAADEDEYNAGQDEWNDLANNPEAAMAYSKRIIEQQLQAEKASAPAIQSAAAPPSHKTKDPDVLFDAEDLSDNEEQDADANDDWGDFEQSGSTTVHAAQSITPIATPPSMDLLGLNEPATRAASAPFKHGHIPSKTLPARTAALRPSYVASDDSWDDFEEQSGPVSSPKPIVDSPAAAIVAPPTNVPPPSVLLSHISVLLKVAPSQANISALLQNAWVIAHIVAGRKLRWKRSPSLAASMRIAPAAAGGKSGMKLAGIDRAEVMKEDREVAEMLTIWRAQVGKLRTIVASHALATNTPSSIKRLPDISEVMPVKSLRVSDGGFVAPHECSLCGLRREERLSKLDDDVQDSFGEWWLDNASMHATCAQWWLKNESVLRSR